jgi:predicted RNA-binding Zn-ribbon protein involved in translation (DUF1610 family)
MTTILHLWIEKKMKRTGKAGEIIVNRTFLFKEGAVMRCKKCGIQMREMKRSYHKQRKWVCPECGRVRMQKQDRRRRDGPIRDRDG